MAPVEVCSTTARHCGAFGSPASQSGGGSVVGVPGPVGEGVGVGLGVRVLGLVVVGPPDGDPEVAGPDDVGGGGGGVVDGCGVVCRWLGVDGVAPGRCEVRPFGGGRWVSTRSCGLYGVAFRLLAGGSGVPEGELGLVAGGVVGEVEVAVSCRGFPFGDFAVVGHR